MLTKGTETRNEKTLADELDRYAIRMSSFANHDDSYVEATCLSEHAERAISILADICLHPTFPDGPFRTAVQQAQTTLNVSDGAPAAVAEREFRRRLFAGHPYGRRVSGDAADLAALRREDLAAFWRRAARPDKATISIAGALAPNR